MCVLKSCVFLLLPIRNPLPLPPCSIFSFLASFSHWLFLWGHFSIESPSHRIRVAASNGNKNEVGDEDEDEKDKGVWGEGDNSLTWRRVAPFKDHSFIHFGHSFRIHSFADTNISSH